MVRNLIIYKPVRHPHAYTKLNIKENTPVLIPKSNDCQYLPALCLIFS